MAKTPSKTRQLTATLWSLVFVVCLGLAAAHLVQAIQGQRSQETNLVEATFTQAPKAP
jgi:cytoskeletal protein RodZ